MCGIAGLYDPRGATSVGDLSHLARQMASTLIHRGPDSEGHWVDSGGTVAFGHRRLSVVDLSSLGHQPMMSTNDRWVLSYNGEIYNFQDLRSQLDAQGFMFQGESDTEVLLAAIQEWGLHRALDACEGMFAFALWDRKEQALHLVRDRFGEKPLYYGWIGKRLAFASELKAFAALPGFSPSLNREIIPLYLRLSYVPAPHTIYEGVHKLLPGHLVTFRGEQCLGRHPEPLAYWSAQEAVLSSRQRPLMGQRSELVDEVEAVLESAVAHRMLADVPVGAFLSGGIDSSLIVALMAKHSEHPVRTFTVGYSDRAFDESKEAEEVANHLETDHTSLLVDESDAADTIHEIPDIWDEPFADVSQIPTLLVSRLARSAVTVSLSGDGGDELFAGYNRHAWLERLWTRAAVVPDPLRRLGGQALGMIPPGVVDGAARLTSSLGGGQVRMPASKLTKASRVLAARDTEDAYLALISHWQQPESLVRGSRLTTQSAVPSDWPQLSGITEQMLWLDLVGYMPDDILVKVDRGAMATSLETRVPFLDRNVLDVAWRLPMNMKLDGTTTKVVLREILYRHVPQSMVDRPKMGFGLPIGSWLRTRLRPWAEDLLSESRLTRQGLLNPAPIRHAWLQHISGRRDMAYELWDVLVLQAWLDRWMPEISS